ncbi:cytochrome P450 [Mycena albidolilacea]|uniref:Cytochrome P450 n=1 Tax=Mycena albidolilacea TaxID=1033008 RepID=A0AAD6Z5Y7_9AGAR|nr:cytochrome P450 [Mycena albidolilacea]
MSSPTPYFHGLVTTVIQPFQPFLNTTSFMIHASGTADSLRSQPLFQQVQQLVQPFLNISLVFYIPLAYCGLYLLNMVAAELIMYYRLRKIPTVGTANFFTYFIDTWTSIWRTRDMVAEGYQKFYGGVYKFPQIGGWMIMASGTDMVEDIRRAPDDELSFSQALEDIFHTGGTLGDHVVFDDYHVEVLTSLTRNIEAYYGDLRDEIVSAYSVNIPPTKEWTKVNVTDVGRSLITRATSRIFVGLPVCQNPEYEAVCINFVLEVVPAAVILQLSPRLLAPLLIKLFANIPKRLKDGVKLLRPIIEERLAKADQGIDKYEIQPNDMISWLIAKAKGPQRTVEDLTSRILFLGFGSIHSTSGAFSSALYHLCAYPEYLAPLREEIEQVVEQEGWTKIGVSKMYRLDSFLKEASRMVGQSTYHVTRKALKDFTFSNGIIIPAGASVSVATHNMHNDARFYPEPELFKGFRFYDMMTFKDGKPSHQMLTTNADYLSFGYGRHACPGRFFAVNMFKIVMAHLLLNYDVRFEDEGQSHPPVTAVGNAVFRYSDVPVVARARQT